LIHYKILTLKHDRMVMLFFNYTKMGCGD